MALKLISLEKTVALLAKKTNFPHVLNEVDLGLIQIFFQNIDSEILPLGPLTVEEIFQRITCLALLPLIVWCIVTSICLKAMVQAFVHHVALVGWFRGIVKAPLVLKLPH